MPRKKNMNLSKLSIVFLVFAGCNQGPSQDVVPSPYSSEECHRFADLELAPVFQNQIKAAATPYPDLNQEFLHAMKDILTRHGPVNFDLRTNYSRLGVRVEAASEVREDGKAAIVLYVPAIMDRHAEVKRSGSRWQEAFRNHLFVMCMHEFDHLRDKSITEDWTLLSEAAVWAKTAERALAPLMKTPNTVFVSAEADVYDAWKKAGGNPTNAAWVAFIRKGYVTK